MSELKVPWTFYQGRFEFLVLVIFQLQEFQMFARFSFEFDGVAYANVLRLVAPTLIPAVGETVLFSGREAQTLAERRLPAEIWRVRAKAYDIGAGAVQCVTLTMEVRSAARDRHAEP